MASAKHASQYAERIWSCLSFLCDHSQGFSVVRGRLPAIHGAPLWTAKLPPVPLKEEALHRHHELLQRSTMADCTTNTPVKRLFSAGPVKSIPVGGGPHVFCVMPFVTGSALLYRLGLLWCRASDLCQAVAQQPDGPAFEEWPQVTWSQPQQIASKPRAGCSSVQKVLEQFVLILVRADGRVGMWHICAEFCPSPLRVKPIHSVLVLNHRAW